MITIEQLLESVDLDFEPKWVTKDTEEDVVIWAEKPTFTEGEYIDYWSACGKYVTLERLKLAEFENKDCQECIYEVPRKTTTNSKKELVGEIKKIEVYGTLTDYKFKPTEKFEPMYFTELISKINELVHAVNELKGAKNE